MSHDWTSTRLDNTFELWLDSNRSLSHWQAPRQHCTRCGATSLEYGSDYHPRVKWFAAWGDDLKRVNMFPPCVLPSNYEAPIGA